MYQSLANGIISASWIALVALGFGIIYGTARFFNFAHGVVFVLAPYLAYLFIVIINLPISISFILAIILSTGLGCLLEIAFYRPLRKRGASPLTLMLASLGLYVVGENIISLIFGKDTKTLGFGLHEGIDFLHAKITTVQVLIVITSLVFTTLAAVLIKKTKFGKAIRAVANDAILAEVSGINTDRVILWSFIIGSSLAGIAGVLVAVDVDMIPVMGLNALIMGVVAFIIGGSGTIAAVAFGALLVGMAQHIGVLIIGSQWQDLIVFSILFIFLMAKPNGFIGKKTKKTAV